MIDMIDMIDTINIDLLACYSGGSKSQWRAAMPNVEISEFAFTYLQSLAVPLVDTCESVLDKMVLEHRELFGPSGQYFVDLEADVYRAKNLPSVKFTMISSATVDGSPVKSSWNHILETTIALAAKKGASPKDLLALLKANVRIGGHTENGFRPVPDAGISFQGLEANRASLEILKLADRFAIPVEINIDWPTMDKAAQPGKSATLVGGP